MAEAQDGVAVRNMFSKSFWFSFIMGFVICFFGVTIGRDTILANLIVLGVFTLIRRNIERRNRAR